MRDHPARFSSLRAFRYPAFVRIWLGAFVSNIGTWIQAVSVGVYVTETTGKAGWTGTIAALTFLPAVFLGPIGGALADRYDRRKVIVPLQVVQAASVTALAVLAAMGQLTVPAIAGLVFVSGCAGALSTPAFNALLSEIVAPEDLLSSVSLTAGQFNLARTIGPVIAAAILATTSIAVCFAVNAVSFVAVIAAVVSSRTTPRAPRPPQSLLGGILDAAHVARSDPGIRLAIPLVMLVAVLIAPFIGLMPAFAIQGFGKDMATASLMAMAQGAGALVAALTANALAQRFGVRRLLRGALTAIAPVAAIYWLAPWYELAFGLLTLLGGLYLWTITSLSTTCMGRVDRGLQARLSSLYSMTLSGGYSLGLVALGWLQDHFGLRVVPAIAAALVLACALVLRWRRSFDALDTPTPYGPQRELGTVAEET